MFAHCFVVLAVGWDDFLICYPNTTTSSWPTHWLRPLGNFGYHVQLEKSPQKRNKHTLV